MAAWRVYWVDQRLETYLTEEFLVCVVRVVVEVIPAWLVTLSAAVTHDNVAHATDLEAAGFFQTGSSRGPKFSHVAWSLSFALNTRYTYALASSLSTPRGVTLSGLHPNGGFIGAAGYAK